MRDSGVAIMGAAQSSGERAILQQNLHLTHHYSTITILKGHVIFSWNITSGKEEITMDEMGDITDYIQKPDEKPEIIMGVGTDDSLGDKYRSPLLPTGFNANKEKLRKKK